jgi:hypothetical protein
MACPIQVGNIAPPNSKANPVYDYLLKLVPCVLVGDAHEDFF